MTKTTLIATWTLRPVDMRAYDWFYATGWGKI